MRCWLLLTAVFLLGMLVSGCNDGTTTDRAPRTNLLVFRYDAARDVVVASSVPIQMPDVSARSYAAALAERPEVSYAPSPELQFANPRPSLTDEGVLTVNYRTVAGLEQLASAQVSAIMAALEAWWWVPGIRQLTVQANGQPLTTLGPITLTQPMQRLYHTYVWQPQTGEVAYLVGTLSPATVANAVTALQAREISEFPATQGFQPLLPPNVTLTAAITTIESGVLSVDLSASFPREPQARLAGIVFMLAQYPEVDAVRFTFGGQTVDERFMLGNLNAPISPRLLLLPVTVARLANTQEVPAIRNATQAHLGRAPSVFGTALVWREWAALSVTPETNAPAQQYLLRQGTEGYRVQVTGANLTAEQALTQNVPREAIIAFRVPGWEMLVETTGTTTAPI